MIEHNGYHGEAVIDAILTLPVPHGWIRTSIAAIGDVRLGRQRSPKNRSAVYPTKYLRAANITWSGIDVSDVLDMEFRPAELETYRLHPGDVLLSEASGSASEVGKPAVWNGELENCCFQNTVIRFRPKAVDSKFALVAFQHFARNGIFSRVAKGVGIHHLSADRFASMPVFLPPLNEQRRIVEKIEELFSDLEAGVAALARARANLKRYRASVLKAAVEGSLTAEWRAKHPNVEPASKLLERLLKERRRKWEADQLAKFTAAGKSPSKDWQDKYTEPVLPDTAKSPVLPKGWSWTSVEQFTENFDGQRIPVKAEDRANKQGQYPYYGASGIIDSVDDYLFDGHFLLLAEDGANLLSRSTPIAFEAEGRFWVNNHAHILKTLGGLPIAYLRHFFNGTRLDFSITGTAQPKLTQAAMNRILVPLPPKSEQEVIVAEVAEKLSQVEAADAAFNHALRRAARLRQSILKQAFEGKLVPQNSSDEPATVLLERLQGSRSSSSANGNGKAGPRNRGRRAKSVQ
jgi:type I restriction enzyme, S subunit